MANVRRIARARAPTSTFAFASHSRTRARRRAARVARAIAQDADDDASADADDALDGARAFALASWLTRAIDGERAPAVFALYDDDVECVYVGHALEAKEGVMAIKAKADLEGVAATRARVVAFRNVAMASEDALTRETRRWIEALGRTPRLNALWEGGGDVGKGEGLGRGREGASASGTSAGDANVARRMRTSEASERGVQESAQSAKRVVVSPFAGELDVAGRARASVASEAEEGENDAPKLELTMENVDKALDEVRPYLITDGGNVEVVSIENGIVVVRLIGACGSCASSSATMKGGIEKMLKKKFGDAVEEVCNVSGELQTMSVDAIEEHLGKLRNSIKSYGGECRVLTLERGVLLLEFQGPQALAFSIAEAIKKKFPLVRECKIKQIS